MSVSKQALMRYVFSRCDRKFSER